MPIKRNDNLVSLSRDHHAALLFCWKIRTGLKLQIETARMKRYVHYFWQTHLQPHFYEEETILFVPIRDAAVQKALNEHAAIKEQVKEIIASENIQPLPLKMLADAVDNHVRYEERELFPHLENMLTEEQLKEIGSKLQTAANAVCNDEFTDEFWKG
ncbi:MAG TPA: hemerythrin domain-containing protein [Parafilimonas sp.]|nr:hemerythrin domain-containing protein [Parafilimonas sp.]